MCFCFKFLKLLRFFLEHFFYLGSFRTQCDCIHIITHSVCGALFIRNNAAIIFDALWTNFVERNAIQCNVGLFDGDQNAGPGECILYCVHGSSNVVTSTSISINGCCILNICSVYAIWWVLSSDAAVLLYMNNWIKTRSRVGY